MNNSAISRGIRSVSIGKKGSKSLEPQLIEEIMKELRSGKLTPAARGAFFGGLLMKGLTADEVRFEEVFEKGVFQKPERLAGHLCDGAPQDLKNICVRLIKKEELDVATAQRLGNFLFDPKKNKEGYRPEPGDGARGLIASILRVRYETPDEYEGLLLSLKETFETPFKGSVPPGKPIIQIAEPFDGVDQSNMITPLVSRHLKRLSYRVVSLVGRSSGPKFGNNLSDLALGLDQRSLKNNHELQDGDSPFGCYLDQKDLSGAMDRWVDLRREIIKRPFMATLERFVDPCGARILMASAFHPPYGEKMLTICERAGFPGAIIIRNGIEGTIAFALKRPTKILCSARCPNGSYERKEFEFDSEQFLNVQFTIEEKLEKPSLEENVRLIKQYSKEERTDNPLFNGRVKATCAGIDQAIAWIEKTCSLPGSEQVYRI